MRARALSVRQEEISGQGDHFLIAFPEMILSLAPCFCTLSRYPLVLCILEVSVSNVFFSNFPNIRNNST